MWIQIRVNRVLELVINHFLVNVLNLFGGFAPVFGLLVYQIPAFNRKYWFIISELALASATIFLMVWWIPLAAIFNTLPFVLFFYPLYLMGFLAVLSKRFGTTQFSKVLALTLMLGFLTTEMHEIPEFSFAYLGLFGHYLYPLHPLTHLYSIITFWLAMKIGKLHFTKPLILLSVLCLGYLYVMYFMCPRTWLFTTPLTTVFGNFCACGRRPLPFVWLATLFYYGCD